MSKEFADHVVTSPAQRTPNEPHIPLPMQSMVEYGLCCDQTEQSFLRISIVIWSLGFFGVEVWAWTLLTPVSTYSSCGMASLRNGLLKPRWICMNRRPNRYVFIVLCVRPCWPM